MDRIIDELNNADKSTKEALKSVEDASHKIQERFQIVNNIYTDSSSVTVERLGMAINNKVQENDLLREIIKHLKDIINVKDAQIKLMLDTLTDNNTEIKKLKSEISNLKNKNKL